MMTVHSAKGLEFPIVFLVGLEDGIFPHSRSINDPKELEEERRLAYVAITRAEKVLYVTHSMRRRVYGEEIAAEPSQFLNEMPLEMVEDLSHGPSWLSYARSATVKYNKQAASALRGERPAEKPRNVYTGKTYDNADAIAEFFRKRESGKEDRVLPETPREAPPDQGRQLTPFEKLKAAGSKGKKVIPATADTNAFVAGSHVLHAKYGKGLVLRREGSGDNVKLTVSFPGFGQKKLIEKFANLERA
jgi:DNA helicase-2/ATP-dependent DNA helicase PcrA